VIIQAGTGTPHIGGVGGRASRVGPAEGLATAIAAGTADGLVLDLDLDLAALNSHDQPVAPTLMLASASAPSADDVLAAALAPAPGGAARITSPTLGLHPAADFEYGVSAVLSGVAQCRGRAAMPPMPRVEAGAATPLAACIAWISLLIRSPWWYSAIYGWCIAAICSWRSSARLPAMAASSSSDGGSPREACISL
jgi:hypothetical protein